MFIHLHNHFKGSFFDSIIDDNKAFEKITEEGNDSIAITDHGQMNYILRFADNARKFGVKPLIGIEFYFVDDAQTTIQNKDNFRNHLVLIVKNETGYKNLIQINNKSWKTKYFRRTPNSTLRGLIDWELLEEHNEGLICLTGCFFGSLPYKILNGSKQAVLNEYHHYKDIFKNDLYLEMGKHGIADEDEANEGIKFLIKKFNEKGVLTQDSHYLNKEDWEIHDTLVNTRFGYSSNFHFKCKEYFMKTEKEMRRLDMEQEYLDNTLEIRDKVEFDIIEFYKNIADKFVISDDKPRGGEDYTDDKLAVTHWVNMGSSEALRRTNLVLGYSDNVFEKVKKAIPDPDMSLRYNLENYPEFNKEFGDAYKKLIKTASVLDECFIDFKISSKFLKSNNEMDVTDYFPVIRMQDTAALGLQFDEKSFEIIGFK